MLQFCSKTCENGISSPESVLFSSIDFPRWRPHMFLTPLIIVAMFFLLYKKFYFFPLPASASFWAYFTLFPTLVLISNVLWSIIQGKIGSKQFKTKPIRVMEKNKLFCITKKTFATMISDVRNICGRHLGTSIELKSTLSGLKILFSQVLLQNCSIWMERRRNLRFA
jgi:hypothetical protein